MRNVLGITIALAAVMSFHTATANCGKTSAFRYEFESWVRRYIFAVIERSSRDIEKIFAITLSELELDSEQQQHFQQNLNKWHQFKIKATKPRADVEEIFKEFHQNHEEFDRQRPLLYALATKNMENALEELDHIYITVSKEYAHEILLDWQHFGTMHDFKTLGQQADCQRINEIMETLRRDENKAGAITVMSRSLFEIFEMHKWLIFLSSPKENSAEVESDWRKMW